MISLKYKHLFSVITLMKNCKPHILATASFTRVLQSWEFLGLSHEVNQPKEHEL